ncbi:probable BOI-related E3 ubiquitin-protein ligase 3 isoform X2 [Physcomitrium patens]|uniref:RING-type domain-containing protein n=1 Tax=Physcomitrium patens TaxID=3218 RepID=A0A2K1IEV8_PHYPA|nr:probable BOI-related E3 ubiquitin-protein ligase 3 isoform X2 [Physcomitrium patens]PNR27812.1 hypothetical protein PHYPA_029964 [Physcomitrium patens]|eukprot:XP_024365401.1 probable BOI-related E3 ubiquitin-protein ligase 3 isoform X2 [Physcomitrella patens]
MAVQAQYPSNVILPDYRNRARQTFAGSNRSYFSPVNLTLTSSLDEARTQSQPQPILEMSNPMRMFNQLSAVAGLSHGVQSAPVINSNVIYTKAENDLGCNLVNSRKRAREDDDIRVNSRQQQQQMLNMEYHPNHGSVSVPPSTTGVSTGLRLSFEDDRLNSTSSASTSGRDISTSFMAAVGDDLNTHLQQQREEVELFFKLQGEKIRQQLEEKRQRYSRALIGAIEEVVLRKFHEKDLEIEKLKRQNQELVKHAEQLTVETHHWQAKTKATEALVTALRANLQQAQAAVAFSREHSKEGCGDSEADDAASSHHGDAEDMHARTFRENRELREQRTCRSCRCNDVSILLLPCRHLCLCKDCEARLDVCPLCQTLKNASVQVYMS